MSQIAPYIPTYVHLLFAALLPIYTGAHASLSRPLNTLTPKQVRALLPSSANPSTTALDEDEDDEEGAASPIENLTATDAMLFPVTAGALLGGLYMLIKYLDDPTLLSRILTWYFCAMGVFAVGKAQADILGVAVSFVFPQKWRDVAGKAWEAGWDKWVGEDGEEDAKGPVLFAVPNTFDSVLWRLRRKIKTKWQVRIDACGQKALAKRFWIGDIMGPVIGALVVGVYALGGKHWVLTNLMGISFSYGAMQLLSPTTFPIATLLLGLLFFYDVFFVFYTPLMVTVATNLDVPIKLLFPRPSDAADTRPALAMLGLGDVVIPGLVIAMALRWDLWRHYERQRRSLLAAARSGKDEPLSKKDEKSLKPRFITPVGVWGERYWTSERGPAFEKTYFHASLAGYVLGMLTTLGVMHVFKHAQPALLYLVPGVLGAVWGTALVRGELGEMWNYSEEGEDDDKKDDVKEKKPAEKKAKPQDTGEDKVIFDIKVVRKPAVRRPEIAKPVPVEETEKPPINEESTEEESETEVVETPMWRTTIIGADG